jgi:hypothetical protein
MKFTPKYKFSLLSLVAFSVMLLLNSCGGGSSGGGSSSNNGSSSGGSKSGIAGINGRIVFSEGFDEPNVANLMSVDIVKGNDQNLDILGKGHGSHIGADGNVIFVQDCNPTYNKQLVIVDTNGLVTPTSSCSNLLGDYSFNSPKFSPDQKKVAVSLIGRFHRQFPMVAVFERDEVDINIDIRKLPSTKIFRGYNAFAWKPDGSLLLIGSGKRLILKEGPYGEVLEELPTIKHGIYVTDKNLNNPVRIENKINSPVFQPDVNKKGTKVSYSSFNNIFIMDLAAGVPQKIRANTVARIAHSPVWSPDGRYIVYAQQENFGDRRWTLYFYELSSEKILSIDVSQPYKIGVAGPLSWVPIP